MFIFGKSTPDFREVLCNCFFIAPIRQYGMVDGDVDGLGCEMWDGIRDGGWDM